MEIYRELAMSEEHPDAELRNISKQIKPTIMPIEACL
jgi:hypothetical protein